MPQGNRRIIRYDAIKSPIDLRHQKVSAEASRFGP
jgi:hypothetical protein